VSRSGILIAWLPYLRLNLAIRVSYSTWLLDALKLKCNDCSTFIPVGLSRMTPTPHCLLLDESSTYNVYKICCSDFWSSNTKSARHWALIGPLNSNFNPNSDSSTDQDIMCPTSSGLRGSFLPGNQFSSWWGDFETKARVSEQYRRLPTEPFLSADTWSLHLTKLSLRNKLASGPPIAWGQH